MGEACRERAGSSGCPGNSGAISDRGGGRRGGVRPCEALKKQVYMVPSKCRPGRGPRAAPGPVGAAVGVWQPPLLLCCRCVGCADRAGGISPLPGRAPSRCVVPGPRRPAEPRRSSAGRGWGGGGGVSWGRGPAAVLWGCVWPAVPGLRARRRAAACGPWAGRCSAAGGVPWRQPLPLRVSRGAAARQMRVRAARSSLCRDWREEASLTLFVCLLLLFAGKWIYKLFG